MSKNTIIVGCFPTLDVPGAPRINENAFVQFREGQTIEVPVPFVRTIANDLSRYFPQVVFMLKTAYTARVSSTTLDKAIYPLSELTLLMHRWFGTFHPQQLKPNMDQEFLYAVGNPSSLAAVLSGFVWGVDDHKSGGSPYRITQLSTQNALNAPTGSVLLGVPTDGSRAVSGLFQDGSELSRIHEDVFYSRTLPLQALVSQG